MVAYVYYTVSFPAANSDPRVGCSVGNETLKIWHTPPPGSKDPWSIVASSRLLLSSPSICYFKLTTAETVMAEASILSSKPKLKTLNKYHDLHKKWYILGAELELDDEELSKVEDEYSDDSMRILKMFGLWLKKGGNPPYRTLLKALVDIDKEDIAQSICTDLGK